MKIMQKTMELKRDMFTFRELAPYILVIFTWEYMKQNWFKKNEKGR